MARQREESRMPGLSLRLFVNHFQEAVEGDAVCHAPVVRAALLGRKRRVAKRLVIAR